MQSNLLFENDGLHHSFERPNFSSLSYIQAIDQASWKKFHQDQNM